MLTRKTKYALLERRPAASTPASAAADALPDEAELTQAVLAAAKGLRWGSIEIVLHDGRVVQVSRTEKKRIVK